MSLMNGAGFEQIYTTLREASISSARASVPADQENILRLVDSGQGRRLFDAQLKRHLQSWFLHSASSWQVFSHTHCGSSACCNFVLVFFMALRWINTTTYPTKLSNVE